MEGFRIVVLRARRIIHVQHTLMVSTTASTTASISPIHVQKQHNSIRLLPRLPNQTHDKKKGIYSIKSQKEERRKNSAETHAICL